VANKQSYQDYFAPEIHSPLIIDESNTFDLTMSTSMDTGKNPMATAATGGAPSSHANGGGRYRETNIISVEPPKQSDLQVPCFSCARD
jgi:hypothetical protein